MTLAACTGDDRPEADPAAEIVRGLPNVAEVESAVDTATSATDVPEDLVPALDFIGIHGVLSSQEQRCARDYGYAAIDELCILNNHTAERSILLWGDSRAAMWIPALSRIADQTGYQLSVLTKLGCAPLLGTTPWLEAESRPYTECAEYNDQVAAVIDDFAKPDIVVLAGAVRNFAVAEDGTPRPLGEGKPDNTWTPDPEADEVWQQGLDRSLESLADNDAEVFVLGEAPYPTQDAASCLSEHEDAVGECAVARKTGVYADHDAAVQKTTESRGATYVSPLPWLCTDEICPAVIDGHVVYRDTFHLNRQYVLHLSRALGSALGLDDWRDLAD